MKPRIHKFYLDAAATTVLHVSPAAQIIDVHAQANMVCIWMIVPDNQRAPVVFTCVNTGQDIPDDAGRYIGTAHLHAGNTVVHVFAGAPL